MSGGGRGSSGALRRESFAVWFFVAVRNDRKRADDQIIPGRLMDCNELSAMTFTAQSTQTDPIERLMQLDISARVDDKGFRFYAGHMVMRVRNLDEGEARNVRRQEKYAGLTLSVKHHDDEYTSSPLDLQNLFPITVALRSLRVGRSCPEQPFVALLLRKEGWRPSP